MLAIERRDPQGGIETLGTFDLTTLENGLVLEAWNILRTLVETVKNSSGLVEGVQISVWFNPCVEPASQIVVYALICLYSDLGYGSSDTPLAMLRSGCFQKPASLAIVPMHPALLANCRHDW